METAIRATRRASEANEWTLVLTALRIPHRVEMEGDVWVVLVPDAAVRRGRAALRAHDEEGQRAPDQALAEAAPGRTAWITGLAAGALLFGFFFVTGPPAASSSWAARGAAVSGLMLNGEPWRAVTALTLHVDLLHVLGNTIATALLLPPIVRRLGPGIGLALVLLAGAAANLARSLGAGAPALAERVVSHSERSASPASASDPRRPGRGAGPAAESGRHQRAAPGELGTGPGTDVIAHALGLVVGAALGLVGAMVRRPVAAPIQRALVAAVALAIVGCWCAALAGRP